MSLMVVSDNLVDRNDGPYGIEETRLACRGIKSGDLKET